MNDQNWITEITDEWLATKARFRKQIIDQGAHFAVGFLGVVALMLFGIAPLVAVAFIMSGALGRELNQHNTIYPWQLGKGSALDLTFWLAGCVIATLAMTVG